MRLGVNARFLGARLTGVQRFAREVVRRLAELTDVTVFLPGGPRSEAAIFPGAAVVPGRLPGPAWEQVELPMAARRARADVLLSPANAAPLWGGPNVVVLHDVTPVTHPERFTPAYRAWARWAHVQAARRAAAVVTVSPWSADEIARVVGLPRGAVHVVSQGVAPLDRPADEAAVESVRRRHAIRGPYLLAVTGDDPRKGLRHLVDVMRARRARRAAVHGNGAGRQEPELVVVGGAHGRVHAPSGEGTLTGMRRLGHVSDEDLRALYTGALAHLAPSEAEGFGRTPLEALACGTRVVAAPYATARHALGGAAELVPLHVPAWVAALDRIVQEPAPARRRSIEVGRAWAARFSWSDTAAAVLGICRAVAENGSRPEPGP